MGQRRQNVPSAWCRVRLLNNGGAPRHESYHRTGPIRERAVVGLETGRVSFPRRLARQDSRRPFRLSRADCP
jgi:hypothetical protein